MTKEEYFNRMVESMREDQYMTNAGCGQTVMYGFMIIAFIICFTLSGCKTIKSDETTESYQRMEWLTERMDSLMHSTQTWQMTQFEKMTQKVDSVKNSEVRDTSRIVFLNEKRDTIKEIIKIKEYIEREHTSHESTQELREEFFRQTDSILSVNRKLEAKMDSVISSHQKTTVVTEKTSFGDKLKWFGGGVVLSIIGMIACISAFIKKDS